MEKLLILFLSASAAGTFFALALLALKPVADRFFSAHINYYVWLSVLLVMMIPIRIAPPEAISVSPSVFENKSETAPESRFGEAIAEIQSQTNKPSVNHQHYKFFTATQSVKSFINDNLLRISYIWLICSAVLFGLKIINYLIFLTKTHKYSEITDCPEIKCFTNKKITVKKSGIIRSPVIFGLIRPTLLLPDAELTREQLKNILAHEITHYKRKDVLCKWFICVAKCIHWFNPIIYFVERQLNIYCEISCDLTVVKQMNADEKMKYAETILFLLCGDKRTASSLSTGMTGSKKLLKKRFTAIKETPNYGKLSLLFALTLSLTLLFVSLFAGGTIAVKYSFESNDAGQTEFISANVDMADMIEEGDASGRFSDTTETPKASSFSASAVGKNDSASFSYPQYSTDGGELSEETADKLSQKSEAEALPDTVAYGFEQKCIKDVTTDDIQNTLIQNGYTKAVGGSADLSRQYIINDYSYKDNLEYSYNDIKCNGDGNISVYFSVNSDNLVDVKFYDSTACEKAGEYSILANNENIYTFTGFDAEKSYDVTVEGKTRNTWKIEGTHIIY